MTPLATTLKPGMADEHVQPWNLAGESTCPNPEPGFRNLHLDLVNSLNTSFSTRAGLVADFERALSGVLQVCPDEARHFFERFAKTTRAFLATRPREVLHAWIPDFREQAQALCTHLLRTEPDFAAARLCFLPQIERGAQLPLLGARLFNLVTAHQKFDDPWSPLESIQFLQAVRHVLAFWEQPSPPLRSAPPQWNIRTLSSKIEEIVAARPGGHLSEVEFRTVKRLVDLIKLSHQWLRWSTPHNLVAQGAPQDLEQICFRFDKTPTQAAQAYATLAEPLVLKAEEPFSLLFETGLLRERWQKALHLLMPCRPPPFLVHFRDTSLPAELLREIQLIQHLWRQDEMESKGHSEFHEVESGRWLLERLHHSRASLFAIIHNHTIHTLYLVQYDEDRLPAGPIRVITHVEGSGGLSASIKQEDGHSEYAFADLAAVDPRDRRAPLGRGIRPYNLIHRAAEEFGELDAEGIRPVKWYAICHHIPSHNPSLDLLVKDGWRDTGMFWENSGGEKYAILKR